MPSQSNAVNITCSACWLKLQRSNKKQDKTLWLSLHLLHFYFLSAVKCLRELTDCNIFCCWIWPKEIPGSEDIALEIVIK